MPKPDNEYWVGFDLGGTKMLSVVYDDDLQQLARARKRTKGHEGAEAGLQRIINTIRQSLESIDLDPRKLAGIGVGCPGPIDMDAGVILDAPNLGWSRVEIKAALEDAFSCPAVISNDVDAGVFGEYSRGAAQGARCALGLFPGTGIGGGCVYEGRIYRGKSLTCMEVGHIQVAPDGPLCGCGQIGCLEAVASRLAISAAAAQAAYRGQAPHLMRAAGTNLDNIRSGALSEAIRAGDRVVEQIVVRAAEHIGTAVAGLVHVLAPDVIVLGGGLVEAMPELIVGRVTATARQRVMPAMAESFQVVAAQLGDDAAALGAAAWTQTMVQQARR